MFAHIARCVWAIPATVLAGIVFYVWAPALLHGRTILHGDSIAHSLPLMTLQAEWFRGRAALSWASGIYGGHPVFAEGQGGFAHPLNLLFAGVVTPLAGAIYSMNLFHAVTMTLTGLGVMGLCRETGTSVWAACFAALAVTFAPDVLRQEQNLTIGGTLTWAPFMLWMVERWVGRGGGSNACLIGLASASAILAGYPQIAYGSAIYAGVRIAHAWSFERHRMRRHELAIAVVVAAGLSAVQWLPLLQLASLSIRSAGIGLLWHVELAGYGLGAVFTRALVPNVGSLLAMLALMAGGLLSRTARTRAHLAATAVLTLLGLETNTLVFRMIYEWHLLPGLHSFRVSDIYLLVAQIGGACIGASGIDRLSALAPRPRRVLLVGVLVAVICIGVKMGAGELPDARLQLVIALLGILIVMGAFAARRQHTIPAMLSCLFAVECVMVRGHPFDLFPPRMLAEPRSVSAFKMLSDWRQYRTFDHTIAGLYSFRATSEPGYLERFRSMQQSYNGMIDMTYGIRSLNGALALPLRRRMLLEPVLGQEIDCNSDGLAGHRMIDVLGVRAFSSSDERHCSGFRTMLPAGHGIITIENLMARPRLQLYSRHTSVDTPAQALQTFRSSRSSILVIENAGHRPEMRDGTGASNVSTLGVLLDTDTVIKVRVSSANAVWLFVADAFYPGWTAICDGVPTGVFPAQILGKAVGVPAGQHEVVLRFRSWPIEAGLMITFATLIGILTAISRPGPRSPASARAPDDLSPHA